MLRTLLRDMLPTHAPQSGPVAMPAHSNVKSKNFTNAACFRLLPEEDADVRGLAACVNRVIVRGGHGKKTGPAPRNPMHWSSSVGESVECRWRTGRQGRGRPHMWNMASMASKHGSEFHAGCLRALS